MLELLKTIILSLVFDVKHHYNTLDDTRKAEYLLSADISISPESIDNELHADTIKTIATIRNIQEHYGESSCHRYIITS